MSHAGDLGRQVGRRHSVERRPHRGGDDESSVGTLPHRQVGRCRLDDGRQLTHRPRRQRHLSSRQLLLRHESPPLRGRLVAP